MNQLIRGHNGSLVLGEEKERTVKSVDGTEFKLKEFQATNGEQFDGSNLLPPTPQVTGNSKLVDQLFSFEPLKDYTYAHYPKLVDAMIVLRIR